MEDKIVLIGCVVFTAIAILLMASCGGKHKDTTGEVLTYAEIGASFGNEIIALQYQKIIDDLDNGTITSEEFKAKKVKLDRAESALSALSIAIKTLDSVLTAKETGDVLSIVLEVVQGAVELMNALKDAGVPIPDALSDVVNLAGGVHE